MKKAFIISSGIDVKKLTAALHNRGYNNVALVNTKGEKLLPNPKEKKR